MTNLADVIPDDILIQLAQAVERNLPTFLIVLDQDQMSKLQAGQTTCLILNDGIGIMVLVPFSLLEKHYHETPG